VVVSVCFVKPGRAAPAFPLDDFFDTKAPDATSQRPPSLSDQDFRLWAKPGGELLAGGMPWPAYVRFNIVGKSLLLETSTSPIAGVGELGKTQRKHTSNNGFWLG